MPTAPVTGPLAELAQQLGVMTRYRDYLQRPVDVGAEAVRRALLGMGIAIKTDTDALHALQHHRHVERQRLGPPCVVVRQGPAQIPVHSRVQAAQLLLEDGTTVDLEPGAAGLAVPVDLPLGYHRYELQARSEEVWGHVIVTPTGCPMPLAGPGFGWMAQLYAVRSTQSWGLGDFGDLAALARWSGQVGATMILINPLHAVAPTLPQQNSPYSPTSRRFFNLLYLRIEDLPEYGALDAAAKARVAGLADEARRAGGGDRIDRDAVFRAKMAALEMIFFAAQPPPPDRQDACARWRAQEGGGLHLFATYCALAEQHGAVWQDWPEPLRHPGRGDFPGLPATLRPRYELHCWIQWLLDTQLDNAQDAGTDAGMAVGIIHDLAVGVDPTGADAWALQDDLATGVTIGAPPDGFNQKGQDWGLPPLLPARLAHTGYAPFRDMLRSVLRHAGGIRIDHIMGLWRLWWVPQGGSPADGTYVRYPARDLLGVLALEADRAGALVVGEDLGTVEDGVRETLAEHRVLSSRVVYFERTDNEDPRSPMLPAAAYPRLALTSVSTHDLPTAAGWWADEEIRVQTELELFSDATTPGAEVQRKARERADMLDLLRSEGLVGEDPSDDDLLMALLAFVSRTPSLLVATSLGDAVGDRRQPNLPGTVDAYPNWRLPLARWDGTQAVPITLDEFMSAPGVRAAIAVLVDRTSR